MSGLFCNGMTNLDPSTMSPDAVVACDNLLAGGSTSQSGGLPVYLLASGGLAVGGLTAQADTTKANATVLGYGISVIATVAGAADSVLLPPALAGSVCYLANAGASSMQVFGQGTDTINAVATATGVAQSNGVSAIYFCAVDGAWWRVLSA